LGSLGLLSQKSHTIQHLARTCARRIQPILKPFVLGFELRAPGREVDVHRAALVRFDLLQACFSDQRSSPVSSKIVRQVADESAELLHLPKVRLRVVGHSARRPGL
jgi:hypothetical protein